MSIYVRKLKEPCNNVVVHLALVIQSVFKNVWSVTALPFTYIPDTIISYWYQCPASTPYLRLVDMRSHHLFTQGVWTLA